MTYKFYRWKWDNYPKLRIIDRIPTHLDLELVAGRCNCKCAFCELTYNPPKAMNMPFEMVKKIIDEFTEKGGSSIKFVYLGEPCLYKHLAEVIFYAKQKGVIDTIIATNGGLLTKELSVNLIRAGLDWITYSVDSCKPEIYKQIRVNGNLNVVSENIKKFHRIRYALQYGKDSKKPKIVIQIIKMNLNENEVTSGEFEKFWKPYVDEISISTLVDYHLSDISGESPNFCCTSPFRRLTIRANGDFAICCGQRLDAKIIGNINENSIEEAWNGDKFNRIRDLMKEGKAHLIDICKNCPTRLIDMQGVERFEKIKG